MENADLTLGPRNPVLFVLLKRGVAKTDPPHQPRWTVPNLIDLEYLLEREEGGVDSEFFETHVEPWIDPSKVNRPDPRTMSQALWEWLLQQRRQLADTDLPGRAFAGAQSILSLLLIGVMLFSASGLVFGLLRYDGRTFNVLVLLSLTVGLPWLLLLSGLLGYLSWGLWRKSAFLSVAQSGLFHLSTRLARRPLGQDAANWWRETARTRELFTLPALALSQTGAIAFSIGALASLLGAILFLSVGFGWETTTTETLAARLHQMGGILASPWSWIRPDWVPTLEEIERSRITWNQGQAQLPPSELGAAWYPFLVLTLLVWGLLPRLLLRGFIAFRQHRELQHYSFQERVHREWWRKVTDLPYQLEAEGPADGAFAVLWGGVSPAEDDLRTAALRQLRLNVTASAEAGSADPDQDRKAIQAARDHLKKSSRDRLILVAEGWSLAPKDLAAFHDQMRSTLGESCPVDVLLVGLPQNGNPLSAPAEDDVSVWLDFAAKLEDPNLFVRPFRDEVAASGS